MTKKVMAFGEVLLRLTPSDRVGLSDADHFTVNFGGSEANTLIMLSSLGHHTALLSSFSQNPMGTAAMQHLKKYGVDVSRAYTSQNRMGIYYYQPGFSVRSGKVFYDRKYSAFHDIVNQPLEWDQLFKDVDVFHTTGITAALSPEILGFTIYLLQKAKEHNVKISFDLNFRSQLWSASQAKEAFHLILPYVDYCFAGFKDLTYLLGEKYDEPFTEDLLIEGYRTLNEIYQFDFLASTWRNIISHHHQHITGYFYQQGQLFKSGSYSFDILERIGAGDAFSSGVIHAVLSGFDPENTVEFGTAAGVLKHTIKGDHAYLSEKEISELIIQGSADLTR